MRQAVVYGLLQTFLAQFSTKSQKYILYGVFRGQALDRGPQLLKVDSLTTDHNADDVAETVLMKILRGDTARLQRCTDI